MAYHPEPDDSWFADQSAHSGLNWDACGEELSVRDDVWYLISNPTMVQAEDWPYRLYANQPGLFMVIRMRKTNDARVPRVEFLQFYCDCVLRLGSIRNRRNADLRGLRQCD